MFIIYCMGIIYDFFSWESDIMKSGIFGEVYGLIEKNENFFWVMEGKYKGVFVMDLRKFFFDMKNLFFVLRRSDGMVIYIGKDIVYYFWKFGKVKVDMFYKFWDRVEDYEIWMMVFDGKEMFGKFGRVDIVINVIGVE